MRSGESVSGCGHGLPASQFVVPTNNETTKGGDDTWLLSHDLMFNIPFPYPLEIMPLLNLVAVNITG